MAQQHAPKIVRMKGNSGSKKRSKIKLRHLALLAFLIWGGYVYWFVQRPLLLNQQQAAARLTEQIHAANNQSVQLTRTIANLHSYSYIATLSEQKYNLILPGDILFTSGTSGGKRTVKNSPKG